MTPINIFWHRRDLRVTDNAGLFYALSDGLPVLPVFIFDTNILGQLEDRDDARVTFIHDQITMLHQAYAKNVSGLQTFHSTPLEVFRTLATEYEIKGVYTNRDYEPYARQRDNEVQSWLKTQGIAFYTFKDQVILEPGEVLTDAGDPYRVFTPFKNKWLSRFTQSHVQPFPSEQRLGHLLQQHIAGPISLEAMRFVRSSLTIPPATIDTLLIRSYAQKRDFPAINGTSRLGVHLRFGTVSIRQLAAVAHQHSDVWLSELIWREFYMTILYFFPEVVHRAFKKEYDQVPWSRNTDHFEKWCAGQTGYPLVDAGMRELNATGYMHNRVRMVVASFLTKHLLIDWRWGEAYFARKLLDFELASNNGGWQWAASTGTDAQPYFRVFNPSSQQERFDPQAIYVRKWVPEYGTIHYPSPMVEHKAARQKAIETFKEAVS